MIPERMTSAAGALGMARAALEVAARYSNRRRAFGQKIRRFQAVSFMVADAMTLLDASRGMVYQAARAADARAPSHDQAGGAAGPWPVVRPNDI